MTETRPAASPTPRAQLAMDKLVHTAERLYAEHGFAGVSIRQISDAAGQRNKSVVQYHFSSRDELIKAILLRHLGPVEQYRLAMVEALDDVEPTPRRLMACQVLPVIEHQLELGTPTWHGRFIAQALVEPSLREYVIGLHVDTPSMRRLKELDPIWHQPEDELGEQFAAMVRQLIVSMVAEREYDLAHGRIDPAEAEKSWRSLGDHLVTALCGMATALFDR